MVEIVTPTGHTFDDDYLVLEALRSGASGFLLKETRPDQLLEAIHVVADGERCCTRG